ncbi:cyclic nucleotide-gated olfactory channel-like isoform X2 [Haliotis rufescens]|uniref:cyclic nucleotide-gated olfactory channel-like isoform X2 n=1 Tax=Haliotis rufescens TaxID=6454 RepID=UPI001EAFB8EA|nr:cyclic nucleotide-gated olfactory channel-like isoform X2 [Haliotis rufescens]
MMVDHHQSTQDEIVLHNVQDQGTEHLPNGPCRSPEEEGGSRSQRSSSDSSSSSKKSRLKKLSRKGASILPNNSNWRRLRATIKASSEMQTQKKKGALERQDSFLRKFSTRNQRVDDCSDDEDKKPSYWRPAKSRRHFVIQHDGKFMFYWLGVMTVAVLYNMWTCIAREAFREIQSGCNYCWFTMDAFVDLLYLLDVLVQFRTGYLDQGLMVYDSKKLARRYLKSRTIYFDTLCLVPTDLIQFYIGIHPMVRFPRFLKVYRTFRFIHMLESKSAYPNFFRVANLSHMLFLGAHWFAAFYYLISEAEGFVGGWSYPRPEGEYASVTRKYLASLFWSTLTLTTIGDLPPPDTNWEYVFVIVSYLIGVFIFATIVGQVGNVITNRNASRQEFERLLDGAKLYMQTHNVPPDLQKRVQRWYDYVWSRGRLNGCDINSLGLLPDKLKTELAIHVNLETLKKVTIFQECQPEFLHDLVLKMRAYIFTPGDLICRRGEVAREMFIVADGVVEVISETGTVLKRMAAGDFFGEIGILNLDGGINRRTADVRSVGYSELFVLSREDVLGALKDHPDAESIIRDYGQRRLREIEAHRQKVKPLQREDTAEGLHGVKNSLLMTIRSMSPKLRRHEQSPSSPRFSKANSLKNMGFSFNSEDGPFDSEVKYSQSSGLFETVCGNLRRLFHRKVKRQKREDGITMDNRGTSEDPTSSVQDNAPDKDAQGSVKMSKLSQVFKSTLQSKKRPGYMAVRTDDQESFDSEDDKLSDTKDNQIIDLTQAGKLKQLKAKEISDEKTLRSQKEYTPPPLPGNLSSSRDCTPSPTANKSSSREFTPPPSAKQSNSREFTPPPSANLLRQRQYTPPPVDNVKKFDIPRCKSSSASELIMRDNSRLALRLSSPPRDYVAHISTPPLASSNPAYSILTPPPAKSINTYTCDADKTSCDSGQLSPRKDSSCFDDVASAHLSENGGRRNCLKRHSVDITDARLNPMLHRNSSSLSVTSPYSAFADMHRLGGQVEELTKVVDTKMATLEEAYAGSLHRLDKLTSVQETLVNLLQENLKLLQSQVKTSPETSNWEHTTAL